MESNKIKDDALLYSNDIKEVLSVLWATSYGSLMAKCSSQLSSIPENSSLNVDKGKMDAFVEIGKKFGFDIIEIKSTSPSRNVNKKIEPMDVWGVLNTLETEWKEKLKNTTESLYATRRFLETVGKMVALQEVRGNLLLRMSHRV
jgi:hypothetical protein